MPAEMRRMAVRSLEPDPGNAGVGMRVIRKYVCIHAVGAFFCICGPQTKKRSNSNMNNTTKRLCEGALMVAASLVLSYFKIQFLAAGAINFCMVPIIVFAVRWGLGWGLLAGAAFGTLKFFLADGYAISIASFFLDYSIAYMAVGTAGLMHGKKFALPAGCLIGCAARFLIHFISGLTIYKIMVPTELFGHVFSSPFWFSVVYNGSYMLPSTVACFAVCLLLYKPLAKYMNGAPVAA